MLRREVRSRLRPQRESRASGAESGRGRTRSPHRAQTDFDTEETIQKELIEGMCYYLMRESGPDERESNPCPVKQMQRTMK